MEATLQVRELFDGGAAAAEGSIRVGDALIAVEGVPIEGLTMDAISDLIVGDAGARRNGGGGRRTGE